MMNPMNEPVAWLAAAVGGLLLGMAFFGGLWWTVRRSLASSRPALWQICSSLLRTAVALAGFYWIGGSSWQRLLACLAGFVLARVLVVRWTGQAAARRHFSPEVDDAAQPR